MEPLSAFAHQKYISVETYRKNGESVQTPVWFVVYENQLCFNTERTSGKVKRIRRNPAVRIAPCDMAGKVNGNWVSGTARFMDGPEVKEVQRLYNKKYGLVRKIISLFGNSRAQDNIFISITITQ